MDQVMSSKENSDSMESTPDEKDESLNQMSDSSFNPMNHTCTTDAFTENHALNSNPVKQIYNSNPIRKTRNVFHVIRSLKKKHNNDKDAENVSKNSPIHNLVTDYASFSGYSCGVDHVDRHIPDCNKSIGTSDKENMDIHSSEDCNCVGQMHVESDDRILSECRSGDFIEQNIRVDDAVLHCNQHDQIDGGHMDNEADENKVSGCGAVRQEKNSVNDAYIPHVQCAENNAESVKQFLVTCLLPLLMPFGILYGLFSMFSCLPRVTSSANINNNRVIRAATTFKPFGKASPTMPTVLFPILLPFMLVFHLIRGILAPLEYINNMQRKRQ